MSVRFGQTLFGGAAGLVAAAGLAVCMAQAHASGVITKQAVPAAVNPHAEVQAQAHRSVFANPLLASCIAGAYGYSSATYAGRGDASAQAESHGVSQVDFSSYGWVNAHATFVSKPIRLAKCRTNSARGLAFGEAEALVAQMAEGVPAVGRARAFGTTYFVGGGDAHAGAVIDGTASYTVGGAGEAKCLASAQAEGRFQIGVSGTAEAESSASGEPAVTVNGVRYFTAYGEATCISEAYAGTVGIHQAQTGLAEASLLGKAWYRLGGAGHAKAYATLYADALAAATAASAIEGGCKALAQAKGFVLYNGKGTSSARAVLQGDAVTRQTRVVTQPAVCKALVSSAEATIKDTKASADDAYGVALVQARPYKTILAYAHPLALAYTASGYGVRTRTGYAIGVGRCILSGTAIQNRFVSGLGEAFAYAQGRPVIGVMPLTAFAHARTYASGIRVHSGSGNALATAQAFGMNQVNDLARAPADRTVFVEAESRNITVEFEDRRIVV